MYLEGNIVVDPTQLTEIVRQKPTKAFGKLASLLTAGLVNQREEIETFSALSILQKIFQILRSIGVNDVIRISKDDTVFYEDRHNRTDDLKVALEHFAKSIQSADQHVFEKLSLVLKHQSGELDYLLDVTILRRHGVGEFPIRIVINGMPSGLNSLTSLDDIHAKFAPHFSTQDEYDQFVRQNLAAFDAYLEAIKAAFEAKMQVDNAIIERSMKVLRPSKRVTDRRSREDYWEDDDLSPVHQSCCHHDNSFLYAWLWADHCHAFGIHCRDLTLVDQQGHDIIDIGPAGFDAGTEATLDTEQPFSLPSTGVDSVHDGHEFQSETDVKASSSNLISDPAYSEAAGIAEVDSSKGGWLSSLGDWASDASSSDDGGSSCSSSSCGGCGGD